MRYMPDRFDYGAVFWHMEIDLIKNIIKLNKNHNRAIPSVPTAVDGSSGVNYD